MLGYHLLFVFYLTEILCEKILFAQVEIQALYLQPVTDKIIIRKNRKSTALPPKVRDSVYEWFVLGSCQ